MDFAEVKRICQTCALAGFKAVYEAGPAKPLRFVYVSAEGTSRDLTKKPKFMGDYQLMRVRSSPLPVISSPVVLIYYLSRARQKTWSLPLQQNMKESKSASLDLAW